MQNKVPVLIWLLVWHKCWYMLVHCEVCQRLDGIAAGLSVSVILSCLFHYTKVHLRICSYMRIRKTLTKNIWRYEPATTSDRNDLFLASDHF